MMAADPEVGGAVAGVVLERELAGAMSSAIYAGSSAAGRAIVTVGGRQERPLAEVRAELGYALAGIAPLAMVGEEASPSAVWSVLIERHPGGTALAELAPMPEPVAIGVLVELAGVIDRAHAAGHVLYGIHPRLCFVRDDRTLAGIAPRSLRFLLGMRPARGGLCLDDVYLPFEVWRDRVGTVASDVFALCALGQFLVRGVPPFAAPSFDLAIAAVAGGARAPLPGALGAVLARGLEREPAARPSIAQLRDALEALRA